MRLIWTRFDFGRQLAASMEHGPYRNAIRFQRRSRFNAPPRKTPGRIAAANKALRRWFIKRCLRGGAKRQLMLSRARKALDNTLGNGN